jgi:O-antigen ligase
MSRPTTRDDRSTEASLAFVVILIAVLIAQNTELGDSITYVLVAVVYLVIVLLPLAGHELRFLGKRWYIGVYVLFALVVLVNVALYQTLFNALRFFALLTFTAINIFVLPQLVPLRYFLGVLSRVSAAVVVVGFAPLVGLPTEFGFVDLSIWGTFTDYGIVTPTSVFVNPNQFGAFALLGVVAAFEERLRTGSRTVTLLLGINVVGLFLSHYRTGWAAFVFASGLVVAYAVWGRDGLLVAVIGGLFAFVGGLLMLFGVVPGPSALTEISLNGRRVLWTNSVRVFQQRPLLGRGLLGTQELVGNPHNSYLRMFASFGVLGGLLYAILMGIALVESARSASTYQGLIITVLIAIFVVIQMFNQLSFIGVSMRSTFSALCLGYYVSSRR